MYISSQCLQNFININLLDVNINEFENKLGLAGFEIEEIVKENNSPNLKIKISTTANRPDVLCIIGLSREISYIYSTKWVKYSKYWNYNLYSKKALASKNLFNNVEFSSTKDLSLVNCVEFFCLKIKLSSSVNIPPWVRNELITANLPISNTILDLANYVMLEWGCCFQCYDFDNIKKFSSSTEKINFKIAKSTKNQQLNLINKNEKIQSTIIDMINDEYIGTSGLNIQENFQVTRNSRNILIVTYSFLTEQIRKSIRNCGIQNEYSLRHEKQVGYSNLLVGIKRLKNLISLLHHQVEQNLITVKEVEKTEKSIKLYFKSVTQVLNNLNTNSKERQIEIIRSLLNDSNLKIGKLTQDYITILVPIYRQNDLKEEIDIIEELARGFGFNNFDSLIPSKSQLGRLPKIKYVEEKIRTFLLTKGFLECYHSSFGSKNELKPMLINPIAYEFSTLRVALLDELIIRFISNQKNNKVLLNCFEFGEIFFKNNNSLVFENKHIGGIFTASRIRNYWSTPTKKVNWFEAFGLIQTLLKKLNITFNVEETKLPISNPYFHPNKTILLRKGSEILGYFGRLHPKIKNEHKINDDIYLFELNLNLLEDKTKFNYSNELKYEKYTNFPTLTYNLIFELGPNIKYSLIQGEIKEIIGDLLSEIQIFEIKRNNLKLLIGIKVILRSTVETLVKSNMDNKIQFLKDKLMKKYKIYFV